MVDTQKINKKESKHTTTKKIIKSQRKGAREEESNKGIMKQQENS